MHKIIQFTRDVLHIDLHPGQAAELSGYYDSGASNWLCLAGRRSGKSLLADIVAAFEAVVPDFSGLLREGEERYILIISTRLDNANLHIRNLAKMLKRTGLVKAEKQDRLELSNGCTILSLPASARAGRGYTASTVIFDELAHFVDSMGNSSADACFSGFTPTTATFPNGRWVITTTPSAAVGIVYELYDRIKAGALDDWFITRQPTLAMNPKVRESTIKRAFERDAESARVEYDAEFADPVAAFFDPEAIERCVDLRGERQEKGRPGIQYAMAIDPAVMADRYAFAICHKEGGNIILDYSYSMKPPINPEAAETLLFDLVERFHPVTVRCDTASTVLRLSGKIRAMEYVPFTRPLKLRIFGATKEAVNLGKLVLFRDNDLLDELKALQIKNNVDIAAPKAGRVKTDDLCDVLALCVDYLSGEGGAVELIRDPFADHAAGQIYSSKMGWGDWNERPHPEGTTWQNCRHRNRGCLACQAELNALGHYAAQAAEREVAEDVDVDAAIKKDEQWRRDIRRPYIPPEAGDADRVRRLFWEHVKNKRRYRDGKETRL